MKTNTVTTQRVKLVNFREFAEYNDSFYAIATYSRKYEQSDDMDDSD